MKRDIRIINIKVHQDKYIDLSQGELLAFIGKNKSGKSTIIQCLESIAMVQNTMTNPIRSGETAGKVIRNGKTRDGLPITIEWEVLENGQNAFRASYINDQGDPKIITDPKVIRELIGSYFKLSVQDVFDMMKYSEGRKEFIKTYLYACLTVAQREEVVAIDLKITDRKNKLTENNLYHQRTAVNKEIESLTILCNRETISEAEETEISRLPKYELTLEKLNKELEASQKAELSKVTLDVKKDKITDIMASINGYLDDYSEIPQDEHDAVPALEWFAEELTEVTALITEYEKQIEAAAPIKKRVETGTALITTAKEYQEKKKRINTNLFVLQEKKDQVKKLNDQIDALKKKRLDIIAKSSLPGGLSFDEETISLNGFEFTDTSLSETEARISIVELLCGISTADFVSIGDWSLYDSESKKKILEIAKKHNRMVIGQLVTDNADVDCQTVIVE